MRIKHLSKGLGVMRLGNVQLEKVGLVDTEELPPRPCPFIRFVESAGAQRLQAGCDLGFKPQGRPAPATEMRADMPARFCGKAI